MGFFVCYLNLLTFSFQFHLISVKQFLKSLLFVLHCGESSFSYYNTN